MFYLSDLTVVEQNKVVGVISDHSHQYLVLLIYPNDAWAIDVCRGGSLDGSGEGNSHKEVGGRVTKKHQYNTIFME